MGPNFLILGKETIRAYVPKNERLHYLRLVGADTSMWEVNKFEEKKEKDKERKEARENRDDGNGDSNDGAVDHSNGVEEKIKVEIKDEIKLDL